MTEDKFNRLYSDVQEIKGAILGDERYGQEGYKQRIERLESEVQSLANSVDKIWQMAVGAGTSASIIISVIAWLVMNWSKIIG